MFRRISPLRPASICPQCTWKLFQYRQLAIAIESRQFNTPEFSPVNFKTDAAVVEDKLLRDIFDSPKVWREFRGARNIGPEKKVGLFKNRYLRYPSNFVDYAYKTRREAEELVERITHANSLESLQRVVKDMDRLSDLLCRVIDLAEFVRGTHPEIAMTVAANKAHAIMYEYMNILNTTTGLHDALKRAMSHEKIKSNLTAEEEAVAKILLCDFDKSGINLPSNSRKKFVDLSNEIARVGARFTTETAPKEPTICYKSTELYGMDPTIIRQLNKNGNVTIPTVSTAMQHALRTVDSEDVRKRLYITSYTSSPNQIRNLEELLRLRGELANLVGHETYASLALQDKMAKSPVAVMKFLTNMASANRPVAEAELAQLLTMKIDSGKSGPLRPWDRDFYSNKLYSLIRMRQRHREPLSAFFSLGTVMQGLSRLFNCLYGIRLVPREPASGETWNDEVRRLDVICESDGHIAVVYCDLFEREGKNPNPAHFTIRCSRKIDDDEYINGVYDDDGMATARRKDGLYQLPTIALICNFDRGNPSHPALLRFRDVHTLFHEMGHALHSMLGRTTLHNVAGTRCATDFAELPSVLMEHFAKSPEVLNLFARHYESDQPLPRRLLDTEMEKMSLLESTETHTQIILALLDQYYHSDLPMKPGFDSTKTYHEVENLYDILPPVHKTSWQGFFTHLYGYGATYYSYLFDRAIAARVWHQVFERNPTSRIAGNKYRNEVLKWGGGREPWKCVAGILDNALLEEGGERAMAEVGRWGNELK